MKKPVRILLVDDNPYFLDVARDYLQLQEAFEVAGVATDGQGALDQVEDLQPDVILLDLNLEQESSINLIPTIKQRRPDIKVIVITIMEVSSYRDAVLQAGADAFVSKSVMTHMLVPSIVNLLEQPAPPVLMSIKRDAPKFTQLIERSKDLIYRYEFFSIKGFSYVNPASEVLTGYTPEEHYADPELGNKLIHPEDRYLFEAIQRGEMPMEQPVVLRWVRKDGSILWTEQYIFPIYNDKGELVAIEGTASDITRQVADEQALREREILIHGIIDSAMDAIISIDANQKILSFNHAAEKMFQYSSAEIVGQSFDQLIPKRVREEYKKVWAENFGQTGVINRIMGRSENIYGLRKNGEEFLLETSISHMLFSGKHHYTLIIRDVTEQRQVEERLRQSERFIHSTLDALNAHIAVLDEMGRIIAVNRAWLEFTRANGGDPEKTGVGTNYLAVCDLASASTDEKYASEMAAGIRSVIHGERESFKMKYPCHAPQEDRWFMAYVTRFEDDGPLRIVIHHENVTEQMLAETTVSHQMSEISFYYENAPVGLAVLDTDLRFLKINQCLASINGLSIEEHIGKTVDEIVPSLVEQAKELAAEIMRSGEPHTNVEFTGETRAEPGIRHIWREGWYPLKAESGQVTGFQVVVEDITDHKQAEADLIAAENRFRTLIENNSDEISIISLEGSLIYESPSADPTLGYKSGEFLGQSIFQLLHPDDLERIQLLFARLIEQPYCQIRDQFRLLHRDGTWRWVEGVGTNLLSEPNVQGVVINYHDITDRKQIEDELRASRERFRQLADNIEEVFWITDARDGREIYMSPAAERVW